MARVLVAVHDPLGLKQTENKLKSPLLIGSYVGVEIVGREVKDIFVIPRTTLRDGNHVWLLSKDDTLLTPEVTVVWRNREDVLIRGDFAKEDRLVVSDLATPVAGMALRVTSPGDGPATSSSPMTTPSETASLSVKDRR